MKKSKKNRHLKNRIALETARTLHRREETSVFRAMTSVCRRLGTGPLKPYQLPQESDVTEHLQQIQWNHDQENGSSNHGAEDRGAPPHDRFRAYQLLLEPLEEIRESPVKHPEGDVLYHSLQVFQLAMEHLPYDEEFLLAALLHDVGKGIDPRDHVGAAVDALDEWVTPRCLWLIENHVLGLDLIKGRIGFRMRRRLEASESFEELQLLAKCDAEGRRQGMQVGDLKETLEYLRELDAMDRFLEGA